MNHPFAEYRPLFPILSEAVQLSSCSQSALSLPVRAAIQDYLEVWQKRGADWPYWMERVSGAREQFARLIGARQEDIAVLGRVSDAASSLVSAVHLLGESFDLPVNSVPYKGGAPLVQDIMGGHVAGGVASMTELIEPHRAGRITILATSGTERNNTLPEIPTFGEAGVNGLEINPWLAFFGPKGLSDEFVADFNAALNRVLARADVQERLEVLGNEVAPTTPAELQEWVSQATEHWGEVIRRSGFTPQ